MNRYESKVFLVILNRMKNIKERNLDSWLLSEDTNCFNFRFLNIRKYSRSFLEQNVN